MNSTNFKPMRALFYKLLILLCIYLLIICRWGYEFGRNDQMQTLSYATFLNNPDLYPNDFYIQGTHAHMPNERFVYAAMLAPFANNLAALSLVLHLILGLLLLWLLYRISAVFIALEQLRWLALLVLFIPLYGINLGGNELYYNSFFVSNLVKVVGLAGIWWTMRHNYFAAMASFVFATLLQPIVGIQLFAIVSGSLLIGRLSGLIQFSWSRWFLLNAFWLFTAGIWILVMRSGFEEGSETGTSAFFDILFVFRAPHHYWPPSWPLRNWLIVGPIILTGTWFYFRRNSTLFLFFVVALIGCVINIVGSVGFRVVEVAALQSFKSTIWLKAFGIIAIFALIEPYVRFLNNRFWSILSHAVLIGAAVFGTVFISCCHDRIPWDVPYDFGWQLTEDPAVDIALKAKEYTASDALFIHPLSFTELKFYGQRSSWVDYKVLVHTKVDMLEWENRITTLYGISHTDTIPISRRQQAADRFFHAPHETRLQKLADKGVTHMLAHKDPALDSVSCLSLIVANDQYAVYSIQDNAHQDQMDNTPH